MKKIEKTEPWIFIFFGSFHLHRIWGLIDRKAYADFWVGVMEQKGLFYFLLMGVLAGLCMVGIRIFLKNIHCNFWWRWVYLLGGGYVLFDLLAIAAGFEFWHRLILKMYDISASYWTELWLLFILTGIFSLGLGIKLLIESNKK